MGSKGSNTTTTNQQQTYAPAGAGYIQNALDRAGQAANLPMNIPQAPVAGFSQDQLSAFQNVNNAQGMAQPYINQAQNYFQQSGQRPDVASYYNPMAANVTAQLQNIFGQQNAQNTGSLTQAAGGVGADRIAVGQANLANQQGLAAGQTYAGLWQQAQQAAQQQQSALQGAGYGTAALGSQAQNAALQGAQAQLGTGGLQQQLSQAQLNAPYQQQLAQAAFPYQQAQFLAGITGSLAPGLGGTTTGQGTTTTPAPSIWSQLLGLGTAGVGAAGSLGAFGGSPSYGGGSAFKGDAYGGSASNPLPGLNASDYGSARGGAIPYAEGGVAGDEPIDVSQHSIVPNQQLTPIRPNVPQLNLNPPAGGGGQSGSGDAGKAIGTAIQLAGMFLARGGRANPYADGGAIDNSIDVSTPGPTQYPYGLSDAMQYERAVKDREEASRGERFMDYGSRIPGSQKAKNDAYTKRHSYADGGAPDLEDRFGAVKDAIASGDFDDQGMNYTTFDRPATRSVPPPPSAGYQATAFAPQTTPAAPAVAAINRAAGASNPYAADAGPQAVADQSASGAGAPEDGSSGSDFAKSPWMALMAAGLGIAGGTSPYAGVNIGQGAMQGLKTLEEQRAAGQKDTTIKQAADRLAQEAKFHEDQYQRIPMYQQKELERQQRQDDLAEERFNRPYKELTRMEQAQIDEQKRRDDLARVPQGFRQTDEGGLEPVPGGPHSAEQIKAEADAKRLPAMSKEDMAPMVDAYMAGDHSVMNGVGRGAQGPQNIQQFWGMIAEKLRNDGADGKQIAAAKANFMAQSAGLRVAAQREAQIETAVNEAKGTFPEVLRTSSLLPRSEFTPVNDALNYFRSKTGSTAQRAYGAAIQAAITAYSQAMNRTGANSVFAQQHAESLLAKADGPEAIASTIKQLNIEMQIAKNAPEETRQDILNRILGIKTDQAQQPATGAPAAGAAAAPARSPQDQQALEWAAANPNDPRAAAIKQRLGVP